MAEWSPTTSYGPGAVVTYQGLTYLRSAFPVGATSGTSPKAEMGTDPKGDPIRTWELRLAGSPVESFPFHIGYFSLLAPDRSDGVYSSAPPMTSYPGQLAPQNPYAGPTDVQQSAYGITVLSTNTAEMLGESIDMDQARSAVPPSIPSAPVMPAVKCGVGMQFFQETFQPDPPPTDPYLSSSNGYMGTGVQTYQNLTYDPVTEEWYQDLGATPRIFYVFLFHNHPLFFRRSHTITFRISTAVSNSGYTIPGTPPIVVDATFTATYSSSTQSVIPTDNNFWSATNSSLAGFIQPSNAVATYTLPNNVSNPGPYGSVDGTDYSMVEVFVSDVESND
jgi:hypothetical protein